ncbi:MAG: hypothetical protein A3I68_00395 [Candidatus Melainabacteria bacterium RIFCSPLOWO2_02_FULL_35_15]|nr:MAG: hypothetical protein A3F80_06480 [Candidatus Melainabacteria bacterium RIFCSPLOWO2_12_FULL_35_11]OGI13725.1 MAG: hypothetical protein A3I68_00395 [Candidatus Melainabacteria bacterium RIFCSPLOWO2_02_FULL_35_15]
MKKKEKLDELHKIRSKNYEETKNMSPKEYINHINKNASKLSSLVKKLETYHANRNKRKAS